MKTEFKDDWKNWLTTNLANGQDKNGLFKILLDEGYSYTAIKFEMQFEPTVPLDQLVNPFHQHEVAAEPKQSALADKGAGSNFGAIDITRGFSICWTGLYRPISHIDIM